MRTATKELMEKSLDDVHGFLTGKGFRSEPVRSDDPLFRRNRYYRRIDAGRLNHLFLPTALHYHHPTIVELGGIYETMSPSAGQSRVVRPVKRKGSPMAKLIGRK